MLRFSTSHYCTAKSGRRRMEWKAVSELPSLLYPFRILRATVSTRHPQLCGLLRGSHMERHSRCGKKVKHRYGAARGLTRKPQRVQFSRCITQRLRAMSPSYIRSCESRFKTRRGPGFIPRRSIISKYSFRSRDSSMQNMAEPSYV